MKWCFCSQAEGAEEGKAAEGPAPTVHPAPLRGAAERMYPREAAAGLAVPTQPTVARTSPGLARTSPGLARPSPGPAFAAAPSARHLPMPRVLTPQPLVPQPAGAQRTVPAPAAAVYVPPHAPAPAAPVPSFPPAAPAPSPYAPAPAAACQPQPAPGGGACGRAPAAATNGSQPSLKGISAHDLMRLAQQPSESGAHNKLVMSQMVK